MQIKHLFKISLFLGLILSLSSCLDVKKLTYFQKNPGALDTIASASAYISKIQPGDIVSVYVTSLSTSASSYFNPYSPGAAATDASASSGAGSNTSPALSQGSSPGFLVDQNGMIEIPLVGQLKIAGLTTSEARDMIKEKLLLYLKYPTVNVRVLNYKISMIGEVARPSIYVVPNENVNLIEAISMAGDLTVYGDRSDVMVIREVNGKKEFGHVDLMDRSVYTSPYYYLHPNDVVYVKPLKIKGAQTDIALRVLPLVISSLSLLIVILSKL
jgi:polysaccharide export outer membrane protein